MNAIGCDRIPRELYYWITFLTDCLPIRSVGTFIELLIGAMLSSSGFITDAYLAVGMTRHWTNYYKWLQEGKWSWLALARQFFRLCLQVSASDTVYLAIDDTLTLRSSKKAPGCKYHHQHGNKPNLAKFVLGQCWVSLAMIVKRPDGQAVALPSLSRLIPSSSNTGKLVAAKTLMRSIANLLSNKEVCLLVDSWYMRKVFICDMVRQNFNVIGQVRIDTRLYDEPKPIKERSRGRPRKYGEQYTAKRIAHLKRTTVRLKIYGTEMLVRYRSKVVKARFLDGLKVKVVWCELGNDDGSWRSTALLLSTDITPTPEKIIESYGLRWSIESMFNQLKLAWGLKEAWQQTRQTLHRWVHITMVAYGLIQLLSCLSPEKIKPLCQHSPWRKKNALTAGQIRIGLGSIFKHVNVRQWWSRKCKKFEPPDCDSIEDNYARAA